MNPPRQIPEARSSRSAFAALLLASGLIALSVFGLAACGDDSSSNTVTEGDGGTTTAPDGATGEADGAGESRAPESADDERSEAPDDVIGDKPGGGGSEDPGPPTREPSAVQEGQIEEAVRDYLSALRDRDGDDLCREIFLPGAIRQIRLPVRKGSCAASVRAWIGHRAEAGAPRWLSASLVDSRTAILVSDGDGRMTATVANRLSGSDRSWIEDDVIYLRQWSDDDDGDDSGNSSDDDWRLVKPSATFYRAVGYRDVPISALTPP